MTGSFAQQVFSVALNVYFDINSFYCYCVENSIAGTHFEFLSMFWREFVVSEWVFIVCGGCVLADMTKKSSSINLEVEICVCVCKAYHATQCCG